MSFSYIWPIAMVVLCNVFYQIFAGGVPQDMDVMASMTVTYLTAAVCSGIMFFVMNHGGNLLHEYGKLNAAPFLLGVSVAGLEAGFIYAYKAGWPVSTAQVGQIAKIATSLTGDDSVYDFDVCETIKSYDKPVLILHRDHDEMVPMKYGGMPRRFIRMRNSSGSAGKFTDFTEKEKRKRQS